MAKLLIEKGANVNVENAKKETPLFIGSLLSLFLLFEIINYFRNIYFHVSIVFFIYLGGIIAVFD